MLRSSILYACETYYNLKETELRQIERIEEGFLRQLFSTTRGCPISQLYLEAGHTPARFEIFKMRILFLRYILNEDPDSLIHKFYKLQLENPTHGDWASSCMEDLKYLEIEMTLEEIKNTSEIRLRSILRKSISRKAFQYLTEKQGSKGGEIKYSSLKMADYLLPHDEKISISDQKEIFSIRNRMTPIPANFSSHKIEHKCECGEIENMRHIYVCTYWNTTNETHDYDWIFTDNVKQLIKVYNRFSVNMEKRNSYGNKIEEDGKSENVTTHVIPNRDPLFSVLEHGNGNIT